MHTEDKNNNRWLNAYSKNITSQFGEDGIIEKAVELTGDNNNWCVEFGAGDGVYCSNTHTLINDKHYSAVLIEADKNRCKSLQEKYAGNNNVLVLNGTVGFEGDQRLESFLKATDIPINFDVLSIDIDGNDYHVWEALKEYKAKLVVIEFNPTMDNKVSFVQPRDMRVFRGSSLLAINNLAKSKGYELIAVTCTNAIFVESNYFVNFGIEDNSLEEMREDYSFVTHIFSGYDGTVFTEGYNKLCWHGVGFNESSFQVLPGFLRQLPGSYGFFRKLLLQIYRIIYSKRFRSRD